MSVKRVNEVEKIEVDKESYNKYLEWIMKEEEEERKRSAIKEIEDLMKRVEEIKKVNGIEAVKGERRNNVKENGGTNKGVGLFIEGLFKQGIFNEEVILERCREQYDNNWTSRGSVRSYRTYFNECGVCSKSIYDKKIRGRK